MRFVFFIPAVDRPVGGVNKLLEIAQLLKSDGRDVIALYPRKGYSYSFFDHTVPGECDPSLRRKDTLKGRVRALQGSLAGVSWGAATTPTFRASDQDVLLVPEFVCSWLPKQLPAVRKVVVVQNGFSMLVQSGRPGFDASAFDSVIATSDACADAAKIVLGQEPKRIPLGIDAKSYAFAENKELQIAYMPRKRSVDCRALVALLQRAPELSGVEFAPIEMMSADEAAQRMREALFFLSFSRREGFGLPPAEAMATGAVTIGFTGVGGDEFFTSDLGFPIGEDDFFGFYDTVVRIVSDYKNDPEPYEALRRDASRAIHQRYSQQAFEAGVRSVFDELSTH